MLLKALDTRRIVADIFLHENLIFPQQTELHKYDETANKKKGKNYKPN